jgi:hypothetical protein
MAGYCRLPKTFKAEKMGPDLGLSIVKMFIEICIMIPTTIHTIPFRTPSGKTGIEIYNMTFQPPKYYLQIPSKRNSPQHDPVQTHEIPRLFVAGILYRAP